MALSFEQNCAVGGLERAADQANQGRFPRAVGPDQTENLVAFERKGDAIDGQEAVKALGEITDFQDGIHLKPGVP